MRIGRYILLQVHTDDGLIGIGEAHPATGTAGEPLPVLGALEQMSTLIIGQDPERIEHIWRILYHSQVFRGGPDAMAALSAVDVALWDIVAQAYRRPVHALLGGAVRDRVSLYKHVNGDTPVAVGEAATRAVEDGYRTVRIYPFGSFERHLPDTTVGIARLAEKTISAVRDAVGEEVDIIVDAVCRLSPAEALQAAIAMAPARPLYFEDPIAPEEPLATSRFASRSPVAVGAGERLLTIFDFQRLLSEGTIQYVRPDPSLVGGITGMRRIAVLAEAAHAVVVPHNPLSPVLTATCVAFAAATSVATLVEYVGGSPDGYQHAFSASPMPSQGQLPVSAAPGLGVRIVGSVDAEPYSRIPIHNADGGLRDF